MKKLLFPLIAVLLTLISCMGNPSAFDDTKNMEKLGKPIKLAYYKHIEGKAFQYADTAAFVITDSIALEDAINEIKNATNPQPWKGAGWDRIIIYYQDTIMKLYSGTTKIGTSASGSFYELRKSNFITKRIKE